MSNLNRRQFLRQRLGFEKLEDRLLLSGTPIEIADFGPSEIIELNGSAYFGGGGELQRTDGTVGGTVQLTDWNPGGASSPTNLTELNGTIFFRQNAGSSGYELHKTDGTVGGAVIVKDISPGPASTVIRSIIATDNYVYFVSEGDSTDSIDTGKELWRSDGTAGGTFMLRNIGAGSTGGDIHELTAVGDQLFFAANNGVRGIELWATDGTRGGTRMVKDIAPGSASSFPGVRSESGSQMTEVNGRLLFAASNSSSTGRELWRSDGTTAGTQIVQNINGSSYGSSSPSSIIEANGMAYFAATGSNFKNGLWKSNGISGATLVEEFDSAAYRSGAGQLTEVEGKVFFTAYDDETDRVLWISDGTAEGTQIVKDHRPGTTGSDAISEMTSVGGKLYYKVNAPSGDPTGTEIWESDGTPGGTHVAFDLKPGPDGSSPSVLTNISESLYFIAKLSSSPFSTSTLWRYTDPIVVTGTSGVDRFDVSINSVNIAVRVNGGPTATYPIANTGGLEFLGGSGADNIVIYGSGRRESVILRKNSFDYNGLGYFLSSISVERVRINGSSSDSAVFRDSTGNDVFTGKPAVSRMTGPGYENVVTGFGKVFAVATSGNNCANLYGNAGANRFDSDDKRASITRAGLNISTFGFDTVNAFASTGNDVAFFNDSPGNDRFFGRQTNSVMYGSGFYNRALGFDQTFANSRSGMDQAYLYDSAGNDRFYGRPIVSFMTGTGFRNQATNFDRVLAYSSGGNDIAYLYDSSVNDRYVSRATVSELSGNGFSNRVTGFQTEYAYASGGVDTAFFFDSSGNDEFRGFKAYSQMAISGTVNRAYGFENANAYATGGNDIARLFGGPLNDMFFGRQDSGVLTGNGKSHRVKSFETVYANANQGGTDTLNVANLSYTLIATGWEN